jgi:hypothetical protein
MNAGGAVFKAGLGVLALYAAWFRLNIWRPATRSAAQTTKCASEGESLHHLQQTARVHAGTGTVASCFSCGCAGGCAAGLAFTAAARIAKLCGAAAAPRPGAEVFGIVTCDGLDDTLTNRCVLSTGDDGKQVVEIIGPAPFVVPANGRLYVAGTLQLSCDVVVARDGELAFGSVCGVGVRRNLRMCSHWTRGDAPAHVSGVDVTAEEECGSPVAAWVPANVEVTVHEHGGSVFAGWVPPKPVASGSWNSGLFARFTPDV